MRLAEPILPCSYMLEADIYIGNTTVLTSSSTVNFFFHNQGIDNNVSSGSFPTLYNASYTVSSTNSNTWSHIAIPFSYTSSTPSQFIQVDALNFDGNILVDNISLKRTTPAPILTITSSPTPACTGHTTTLTVSGASTYTWSTSSNSNSISVSPASTTVYSVTGTSSLGCTSSITTLTVAPTPTISVTNPTLCANGTSTLVFASGADTYTWSTGSTSSFISVTAPTVTTTYTVVGTKTLTGCTNTAVATVVVNPLPNATLTPNGSISLCGSQTITLNAISDVDPNTTYAWTLNSGTSVGTGHSINVSLSGNYQVLITNTITGCVKTYSTPVYIAPTYVCNQCLVPNGDFEYYANLTNDFSNIVDAPFWNAPTVGTPDYYNTASTILTTIPNNGFTSSTPDHTGNATQGYAGFINYDLNSLNQREYIQTPLNCSLEPNQVYNVSLWAQAANLLKYTTNNIGIHLSTNSITGGANLFAFTPQLNFSTIVPANTWSQLTGTVTGNNENYITIGNFKNDANTTFTLSNPGGIGGGTAYYFVDDVSIVPVAPSYTASTTSCITSGSAVTLTLSGSPGYYITNGVTTQTLNAATGTIAVSPTVTTTYTINPILVCNKCNVFSTITVSVSPSVTLSASNSTLCSGNSSILTASGATTYSWNTGATTNSISVSPLTTTVYTVTGITGGCTNTKTVTITVNTTPTVAINNATICSGTSTVLTASGATSYSWSTGATTNTISVSPSSTTIYTVTGTNSGCTNTKTISVTVKTTPTVTVNSATICSGQTTTLNASGATTYSWNTSVTTNSIAVSPASTTNYTVTGTTNGCSNTKTTTVTVNPSPTVTAVANPTSICVGQTATLTAGGATTYSWNTGATTNTISVSPSVTTVYTVTGTTASCSSIKTVTIIVGPVTPTITASASSVAVCSGGSATLTASGASNYTWSPVSIYTSTAVVTPTAAIIYTLSGSYGSGCNTATTTLLVNPIISTLCCTAANSSISTSTIASGNYTNSGTVIDVQGVITFTGNTTFNGYTFRMKPNTLLRVMGEYTLTLNNCKLFSCSELWNGIELVTESSDDHGHLALNNTVIEDMYNGIFMDGLNLRIDYPMTNAIITSTASILNKNYTSIQFKNIDGMFNVATMTPTNVPYPFSMITTTLSSYPSTTSPGSTLKPSSTYTYAYNNITNGTMGGSAPYLNFPRAYVGISLNNLRNPSSFIVGNKANAAHTNVFDNLDFGINAANAKIEAYNNYFKNITGSTKQGDFTTVPTQYYATGPDEIGIAIGAVHSTLNTFDVNVGYNLVIPSGGNPFPRGNKFENCNRGIKAINCNNVYVMANTFTASTTSLPVVTTVGSPPYQFMQPNPNTYYYYNAQSAIFVSGLSYNMETSYNDIKNYGNGIYCNYTSNATGSGIKCYTNDIASPSATGYCMQAIQVDQSGGFTTSAVDVMSNTITAVYRGIAANGVKNNLAINLNEVTIQDVTKTLNYSASSPRTGISISGCDYGRVQGNRVTSNANAIPTTSTTANYQTGIYVKATPNARVECNSTYHLGRNFVFEGACANSSWKANTMQDSYRGLEMRLSAVIGDQGAVTYTGTPNLSANTWTTVTEETFVLATNPNPTSKLFILNNVAGNPKTLPTANYPTASTSRYQTGFGNGLQNLASGTSYTCNGGYAQRMANTNADENNNSGGSHQKTANTSTDSLTAFVNLATADENSYEVFADEMQYQNKRLVYQLIEQDSINPAASSVLNDFYTDNQNTAIGKLTEAETAMGIYDISAALQANNSAPVTNMVEQKYQKANELTLKYMADFNYAFTDAEKSDLYNMANECPAKGAYVSSSRNLVNVILRTVIMYEDNCDAEANASRKAKPKVDEAINSTAFNLYPNPNNGIMQLDYNLGSYTNAKFNLFDITGKLIQTKNITSNEGSLFINEQNLDNGIYFYSILVGEKTIKTDKIVIIK